MRDDLANDRVANCRIDLPRNGGRRAVHIGIECNHIRGVRRTMKVEVRQRGSLQHRFIDGIRSVGQQKRQIFRHVWQWRVEAAVRDGNAGVEIEARVPQAFLPS